jgi:hypothetical protein
MHYLSLITNILYQYRGNYNTIEYHNESYLTNNTIDGQFVDLIREKGVVPILVS